MRAHPLVLAAVLLCVTLGWARGGVAGPWRPPFVVSATGSFAAVPGEGGLGGYGGLWLGTRVVPWLAPEIGIREGAAGPETRLLTDISIGARFLAPAGRGHLGFRIAFAHQHEMAWERARHQLPAAVAGAADGMAHRSGVELGGSLEGPVPGRDTPWRRRLRPFVGASVLLFPDDNGPRAYALVEGGVHFGIGREPGPGGAGGFR